MRSIPELTELVFFVVFFAAANGFLPRLFRFQGRCAARGCLTSGFLQRGPVLSRTVDFFRGLELSLVTPSTMQASSPLGNKSLTVVIDLVVFAQVNKPINFDLFFSLDIDLTF